MIPASAWALAARARFTLRVPPDSCTNRLRLTTVFAGDGVGWERSCWCWLGMTAGVGEVVFVLAERDGAVAGLSAGSPGVMDLGV